MALIHTGSAGPSPNRKSDAKLYNDLAIRGRWMWERLECVCYTQREKYHLFRAVEKIDNYMDISPYESGLSYDLLTQILDYAIGFMSRDIRMVLLDYIDRYGDIRIKSWCMAKISRTTNHDLL